MQHTATRCNTLQHTATHCNTRQHTATHDNALQHTATHCIQAFIRILSASPKSSSGASRIEQVDSRVFSTCCRAETSATAPPRCGNMSVASDTASYWLWGDTSSTCQLDSHVTEKFMESWLLRNSKFRFASMRRRATRGECLPFPPKPSPLCTVLMPLVRSSGRAATSG